MWFCGRVMTKSTAESGVRRGSTPIHSRHPVQSCHEIFARVFHAPSWHFRTFAPGEAWARHCRRARHVACSRFERCRPFGERAPRANRSGAIKLPLKAAASARQRGAPAPHARRHERGALVGPCVPSDARSAERGAVAWHRCRLPPADCPAAFERGACSERHSNA